MDYIFFRFYPLFLHFLCELKFLRNDSLAWKKLFYKADLIQFKQKIETKRSLERPPARVIKKVFFIINSIFWILIKYVTNSKVWLKIVHIDDQFDINNFNFKIHP